MSSDAALIMCSHWVCCTISRGCCAKSRLSPPDLISQQLCPWVLPKFLLPSCALHCCAPHCCLAGFLTATPPLCSTPAAPLLFPPLLPHCMLPGAVWCAPTTA
eukprot:1153961-Pelagomonas_calceolata.AAC.3